MLMCQILSVLCFSRTAAIVTNTITETVYTDHQCDQTHSYGCWKIVAQNQYILCTKHVSFTPIYTVASMFTEPEYYVYVNVYGHGPVCVVIPQIQVRTTYM